MKSIEWADITLNPVIGCKRGCPYCYAHKMNDRFHFVADFTKPQLFLERLEKLNKIKSKRVFMNSMSDIGDWDKATLEAVGKAISKNDTNRYYFLTKRLDTIERLPAEYKIQNVIVGLTVTNQKEMDAYLESDLRYRLINIEPILEYINFSFDSFNMPEIVILGAETGNRKGKVIPEKHWIEHVIFCCNCKENNIDLFLKENIKKYFGKTEKFYGYPINKIVQQCYRHLDRSSVKKEIEDKIIKDDFKVESIKQNSDDSVTYELSLKGEFLQEYLRNMEKRLGKKEFNIKIMEMIENGELILD